MCARDPLHHPMLVLLCRVPRPKPARPCRGTLRRKHLRLISNLPQLCGHVPCHFATYPGPPGGRPFSVVFCFLLPWVISSYFWFKFSARFANSANAEFSLKGIR